MTAIRLDPRIPCERAMIAEDFGWPKAWELTIRAFENDIQTCTHGDARHPSHRLQKELSKAKFELSWLTRTT
jgi:hypothetical protein